MPAPDVHPFTEQVYDGLPEAWRRIDEQRGYPHLRWLACLLDQAGDIVDLIERIDYVPEHAGGDPGDTSDLVDPLTADIAWLPWQAQLVGALLAPSLTEAERRDAIAFASSGWRGGNKAGIADAARTVLTGTKLALVYPHTSIDGSGQRQPDTWPHITLVTRQSETPDPDAVVPAVEAKNAVPAGGKVHHSFWRSTWADRHQHAPTWADMPATWTEVHELGFA